MTARRQPWVWGRGLLERLEHRLAATPEIVDFCRGEIGLRGVPAWDHDTSAPPAVIALDWQGVVWLIDVKPSHHRRLDVATWCLEQSVAGDWQFDYLPLDRAALSGVGAIAFTPYRW